MPPSSTRVRSPGAAGARCVQPPRTPLAKRWGTTMQRRRGMTRRLMRSWTLGGAAAFALAACGGGDAENNGAAAPAGGAAPAAQPAPPPQPPQEVRLEVDVAARQVRMFRRDQLEKSYGIAVGTAEWPTQNGNWNVTQVVWNPAGRRRPTRSGPRTRSPRTRATRTTRWARCRSCTIRRAPSTAPTSRSPSARRPATAPSACATRRRRSWRSC
jgi:hypothetical protein